MARLRLRVLLQEFDLVGSEVVIGRSPDCFVTLEDPMVSRWHAKIAIDDGVATLHDLGSRNGVRVNGDMITEPRQLQDGDRIRLGTQEMVFSILRQSRRVGRNTGHLKTCRSCGVPYPEGSPHCPHCGAVTTAGEDETMSGLFSGPERRWTHDLLGEVIMRALERNRLQDAKRMVAQVTRDLERRLAAGDNIESSSLGMITGAAVEIAHRGGPASYLASLLAVHRQCNIQPSDALLYRLETLEGGVAKDIESDLSRFAHWLHGSATGASKGGAGVDDAYGGTSRPETQEFQDEQTNPGHPLVQRVLSRYLAAVGASDDGR